MKHLLIAFALLALVSCKKGGPKKDALYPESQTASTPAELGREIFGGKGNCFACHKPDQKIIGPSIREIAKIYKDKNGNIVSFLKGDGEPLVDPSQYEVMKTNFAITKGFSKEELEAVEAYIYSNPE